MTVLSRVIAAVGLSTVVLFALSAPTNAQSQRNQGGQEDQKDAGQGRGRGRGQQDPTKHEPTNQAQRRTEEERQDLIRQHEQRLPQYREALDQQERAAEQRAAELQRQKRKAQHIFEQDYLARLREQRLRIQSQGRHDYDRDPFFYTPSQYRYSRGGRYHETNQYGLDLLRQAVNYGYEEGFRAGRADREDRWPSNYRDCYAYQDANYGYRGFYVDRDDYNYYFREGFRRGYEDGYGHHYRYGSVSNGKVAILAAVLAGIITYELIR
jgi:hypothetical protein